MERSAFMKGNNCGMVAASHSKSRRVAGAEPASGTFSSTFFTEILISLFTPIPAKSTCSSAASTAAIWAANLLAALLFAVGHLPGTSTLAPLTALLVTGALLLNGLVGLTCGYLYWRRGIEAAILAHTGFHLVWQLPTVWIARALMGPVSN